MRGLKPENLFGRRFGNLVAIAHVANSHPPKWLCACACGVLKEIRANHLKSGAVVTCGCGGKTRLADLTRKHGKSGTRTFRLWAAMRQRCQNPKNSAYPRYGGRGIIVCNRWNDFSLFFADMGNPPNGMTLERKDNDQGYNPDNCIWADRNAQANNRRSSHFLTWNDETLTLAQWAKKRGIGYGTLLARIQRGWPTEKVLDQRKFGPTGQVISAAAPSGFSR